jgi:hypothetical protein
MWIQSIRLNKKCLDATIRHGENKFVRHQLKKAMRVVACIARNEIVQMAPIYCRDEICKISTEILDILKMRTHFDIEPILQKIELVEKELNQIVDKQNAPVKPTTCSTMEPMDVSSSAGNDQSPVEAFRLKFRQICSSSSDKVKHHNIFKEIDDILDESSKKDLSSIDMKQLIFLLDKKLVEYISGIGPLREQVLLLRDHLKSTISNFKQRSESVELLSDSGTPLPSSKPIPPTSLGIPTPAGTSMAENSGEESELETILKTAIENVLSESLSGREIKNLKHKFAVVVNQTLPELLRNQNQLTETSGTIIKNAEILNQHGECINQLNEKMAVIVNHTLPELLRSQNQLTRTAGTVTKNADSLRHHGECINQLNEQIKQFEKKVDSLILKFDTKIDQPQPNIIDNEPNINNLRPTSSKKVVSFLAKNYRTKAKRKK